MIRLIWSRLCSSGDKPLSKGQNINFKTSKRVPVHTEDLLVDHGGHGKTVEAVRESLPKLDVVSSLALVVEAIDPVDGSALVVAAEYEEVLRVLDLVREEQGDRLQTLFTSVHIVTQEEVVRCGRKATILEQPKQVVVLAMYVPTDFDGSFKFKKNRLSHEDLTALDT